MLVVVKPFTQYIFTQLKRYNKGHPPSLFQMASSKRERPDDKSDDDDDGSLEPKIVRKNRFRYKWGGWIQVIEEEFGDPEFLESELKAKFPTAVQQIDDIEKTTTIPKLINAVLLFQKDAQDFLNSPTLDALLDGVTKPFSTEYVPETMIQLIKSDAFIERVARERTLVAVVIQHGSLEALKMLQDRGLELSEHNMLPIAFSSRSVEMFDHIWNSMEVHSEADIRDGFKRAKHVRVLGRALTEPECLSRFPRDTLLRRSLEFALEDKDYRRVRFLLEAGAHFRYIDDSDPVEDLSKLAEVGYDVQKLCQYMARRRLYRKDVTKAELDKFIAFGLQVDKLDQLVMTSPNNYRLLREHGYTIPNEHIRDQTFVYAIRTSRNLLDALIEAKEPVKPLYMDLALWVECHSCKRCILCQHRTDVLRTLVQAGCKISPFSFYQAQARLSYDIERHVPGLKGAVDNGLANCLETAAWRSRPEDKDSDYDWNRTGFEEVH